MRIFISLVAANGCPQASEAHLKVSHKIHLPRQPLCLIMEITFPPIEGDFVHATPFFAPVR